MPQSGQSNPMWDDGPLVKKARKGDAAAWGKLVERYSGYVNSILRNSRVPDGDMPDAFQYVFVELFKALSSLENSDYLAPWIRQTATRHAIRLRDKAAKTQALPEYDLPASDNMELGIQNAETGLIVRQSIDTLKEQCRKLITMLFFEDPPRAYNEVAQDLGIAIGSIGNTRQRCLDTLEKTLRSRGVE